MTGGQAVIRSLKAEKVEHMFGLIGSATIEVFDALYEEKKIIYCYLNIIFLAIASYCSVNFCLFAIYFFYKFFSYYKFSLNIFYLILTS